MCTSDQVSQWVSGACFDGVSLNIPQRLLRVETRRRNKMLLKAVIVDSSVEQSHRKWANLLLLRVPQPWYRNLFPPSKTLTIGCLSLLSYSISTHSLSSAHSLLLIIVEEVLLEARVLAAVDNCAVVLLASVWLALAVPAILLFAHQVLIKHFLISDLVVIHLIV